MDSRSRQELLAWLNNLLQLNITKVEQCGTGYVPLPPSQPVALFARDIKFLDRLPGPHPLQTIPLCNCSGHICDERSCSDL
jgi:hypothetical protein